MKTPHSPVTSRELSILSKINRTNHRWSFRWVIDLSILSKINFPLSSHSIPTCVLSILSKINSQRICASREHHDYFQFYPRSTLRRIHVIRYRDTVLSILSKINMYQTPNDHVRSSKTFNSIQDQRRWGCAFTWGGQLRLSILSKINLSYSPFWYAW